MSFGEYLNLLCEISQAIDWEAKRERLMFIINRYLPDDSGDEVTDVNSSLAKLEEKSLLGIDRLDVLKDLLKGIREWRLLEMVDGFEVKRKEYKQFLGKIIRALDESNELQRLISICKRQNLIAHEREEHIANVDTLFAELEQQKKLGVGNLGILRTMATDLEKPDLCRLLDDFEEKRKQEDDVERKREEWDDYKKRARAQATSILVGGINVGEGLIGVVTPVCTFRNITGGAVIVTTWMVLRRSNSLEAFVNAFKEAVLPFGNCLRAISEGSIRFTLQAENVSALKALWQRYQNETLQTDMQEFLVTEEIKLLGGGEVTLSVYIDEEEYRNAMWDFIRSETEERRGGEQRGLKDRASSESDLLRTRGLVSENGKDFAQVKKFMPFERKIRVEEFLENLQETYSTITRTSDSGVGAWSSASSECGSEEGAEESREEKLNHIEERTTEAIENLDSALSKLRIPTQSEVVLRVSVEQAKKELENSRGMIHNLRESGNEIPVEDDQMALVLGEVKEYLFSPKVSAEGVIQKIKTTLQIDQDMFENPDAKGKKLIRLVARTAKHLDRIDVFHHLRKITPSGTTGPRLPDDLPVDQIPLQIRRNLTMLLSGDDGCMMFAERLGLTEREIRFLDKRTLNPADAALSFVGKQRIISVGLLYDLLKESMLLTQADLL